MMPHNLQKEEYFEGKGINWVEMGESRLEHKPGFSGNDMVDVQI